MFTRLQMIVTPPTSRMLGDCGKGCGVRLHVLSDKRDLEFDGFLSSIFHQIIMEMQGCSWSDQTETQRRHTGLIFHPVPYSQDPRRKHYMKGCQVFFFHAACLLVKFSVKVNMLGFLPEHNLLHRKLISWLIYILYTARINTQPNAICHDQTFTSSSTPTIRSALSADTRSWEFGNSERQECWYIWLGLHWEDQPAAPHASTHTHVWTQWETVSCAQSQRSSKDRTPYHL